MDRSIWAISCDVDAARHDAYLAWFHRTHIPEKLARPGYAWAAHYRGLAGARHLALFGAADAGAFLSPSPGQLKTRQDALTREMMGLRIDASVGVFAEAMRVDGPQAAARAPGTSTGPFVRYANFSLPDAAAEDAASAWMAQQRFAKLGASPGAIGARLMVAVLGAHRYAVLEEFATEAALHGAPAGFPAGAVHAPGSPFEGRRLWPA
ncbi:MAG TPA: hypothetical protein VIS77_05255 [Burkholderiales bacterium]